jgi:predicted ATP-grasp superfamily ATP-dependent carboligase
LRILIHEYITGGGLLGNDPRTLESLLPEGEAMVAALAREFSAIAGADVLLLRDHRLRPPALSVSLHHVGCAADELTMLGTLAAGADWTVVIAPENDGILLERARRVEEVGGRLLSPPSGVVDLCSDKRRTTEHLRRAGLPCPKSYALVADASGGTVLPRDCTYPAVLKRIDGAGGLGMRLMEQADARIELEPGGWMLETFVPGVAASASVLCGPRGHVVLPPFTQDFEASTFAYLGGTRLADHAQAERARRWAGRAAACLPRPIGYLGIDLVLGDDPLGGGDAVIEVNPRLTTSFVGLCAIARTNLAEAMLDIAGGRPLAPDFSDDKVSFCIDGTVRYAS